MVGGFHDIFLPWQLRDYATLRAAGAQPVPDDRALDARFVRTARSDAAGERRLAAGPPQRRLVRPAPASGPGAHRPRRMARVRRLAAPARTGPAVVPAGWCPRSPRAPHNRPHRTSSGTTQPTRPRRSAGRSCCPTCPAPGQPGPRGSPGRAGVHRRRARPRPRDRRAGECHYPRRCRRGRTSTCSCACAMSPRTVTSLNVCDGLERVTGGRFPVSADGSIAVDVELWPAAHRFRPGHRLRVQVSAGAHPRYARNPGTGESLARATDHAGGRHRGVARPRPPVGHPAAGIGRTHPSTRLRIVDLTR